MVEPFVEPVDKLSLEEIKAIPQDERSKFMESAILVLIQSNGSRGLSLAEIERSTQFPKNTLYKLVELLFAKRKIARISRGRFATYYPIGQPSRKTELRDIMYGRGQHRRYGVQTIETIDGKYALIQERELDENGFPEDIGGVLIPIPVLPELINMLRALSESEKVEPEIQHRSK